MSAQVLFTCCSSSSALAQDDNIPRTPYGHPDLQGNWINDVQAPLVRPEVLGEQQAYTEAEVRTLLTTRTEQQRMRERASDPNRPAPPTGDTITNIADGNFLPEMPLSPPYVNGEYRTSLIIDPPNGRVPLIDGAGIIMRSFRPRDLGNSTARKSAPPTSAASIHQVNCHWLSRSRPAIQRPCRLFRLATMWC